MLSYLFELMEKFFIYLDLLLYIQLSLRVDVDVSVFHHYCCNVLYTDFNTYTADHMRVSIGMKRYKLYKVKRR